MFRSIFSLLMVLLTLGISDNNDNTFDLEVNLLQTFDNSVLMAISPDGTKMLIEDWGKKGWPLRLVEIGTWKTLNNYTFKDRIITARFFADSQTLFFYQDNSIFNLKTGEHNKLKRDLRGDTYLSDIYPVNGRNLLVRRPVESIRTQDLVLVELPSYKENKKVPYATQQRELPPPTSEFWSRPSLEFGFEISNDRRILAYSFDHVLVCRRTKDLEVLWIKRINPPLRAYSISISPNGNYLAAILANAIYKPMRKEYYIAVYDGNTGADIARIPLTDASDYTVSPNGRLLAFSESKYDKAKDEWVVNIQIYELPTCRKLVSIRYDSIKNSSLSFLERGLSIDFTQDGRYIITCGNGITKIWELRGGVAETEITPHNISSK